MAFNLQIPYLQRVLPHWYGWLPKLLGRGWTFPPLHVFFEVTYRCNLRCSMCHFIPLIEDTESRRTYDLEMNAEDVKKIIAQLPRFAIITFTGGEAFMKKDFMDILEFASRRNKTHVITNGTVLDHATVDRLLTLPRSRWWRGGLFFLGVSMEGGEAIHDRITTVPGSWQKTREGIRRLLSARGSDPFPKVHLTCVIKRNNVDDLCSLYDDANQWGVDVCNFVALNPVEYEHGNGFTDTGHLAHRPPQVESINPLQLSDQLRQLIEKSETHRCALRFSPNGVTVEELVRYYSNQSDYRNYRCIAVWSKLGITAYGDVFSCPHRPMGNLLTFNSKIPWNSKSFRKFRAEVGEQKIFPACLGCCQSEYIPPNPKKNCK